jgi:hypothetical protein
MKTWDPDLAIQELLAERAYDGINLAASDQGTTNEITKRILREAAPMAAKALVHLAQFADSDRIRMQAATYIVDRNLGRLGDNTVVAEKDPFEELLAKCIVEVRGN